MTSMAPQPQWERDRNPRLTYPIVTPYGIREMTRSQITGSGWQAPSTEERLAALEDKVARQGVMIENIAKTLNWYFSSSNPNA